MPDMERVGNRSRHGLIINPTAGPPHVCGPLHPVHSTLLRHSSRTDRAVPVYRETPLCILRTCVLSSCLSLPTSRGWVPTSWSGCWSTATLLRRRVEAMIAEIVGAAERTWRMPMMVMRRCRVGSKQRATTPVVKPKRWCRPHACCTRFPRRVTPRMPVSVGVGRSCGCWPGCSPTRGAPISSPTRRRLLLESCVESLWFNEFAVVVQRWEALADADGAHAAHERAHQGRDAQRQHCWSAGLFRRPRWAGGRGGDRGDLRTVRRSRVPCRLGRRRAALGRADEPGTVGTNRPAATFRCVQGDVHRRRRLRCHRPGAIRWST